MDEFVGYWITMFLVPVSWGTVLAGFALFRLLDIWKPWPICWIDKHVQGGLGIMLDDVIAGAAACIILHSFARAPVFEPSAVVVPEIKPTCSYC